MQDNAKCFIKLNTSPSNRPDISVIAKRIRASFIMFFPSLPDLFSAMCRTSFAKCPGHGDLLDQRHQQIAQDDRIGNALRAGPKDPEDACHDPQKYAKDILPFYRDVQ